MSEAKQERASKKFWVWHGDLEMPRLVTGYECPPNERVWWCPEVGYSLWEGTHLFETEQDALKAALEGAEARAAKLSTFIAEVRERFNDFLHPIISTGTQDERQV